MKNQSVFLIICFLLFGTALCSAASAKTYKVDNFESVEQWAGSSKAEKNISVNEEKAFIKSGNTSLKVSYPQSTSGNNFTITHTDWRNGGMPISKKEEGYNAQKLGMWVYGCSDANISITVKTQGSNQSGRVDSVDVQTLDFEGWKYLEFTVDPGTEFLYGIVVKSVSKIANVQEWFYIDSLDVIYEPNQSTMVDLDVQSDILDGAERVDVDCTLNYTFTNPLVEGNPFEIEIFPAVDFRVIRNDDKHFSVQFGEPLKMASEYTVSFKNVKDVYEQTTEKEFHFYTKTAATQIVKMESNDAAVNSVKGLRDELSVTVSYRNFTEDSNGETAILAVYDQNEVLIGINCVSVPKSTSDFVLSTKLKGESEKASVIILKSLAERKIIDLLSVR